MSFDPNPAAELLETARRERRQLAPLPPGIAPSDALEGAAVQRVLARRMGVIVPDGFKIGATAIRMQEYLGLSGPAAGFIAADDVHDSGATLSFRALFKPGVECELAVRLGADLPPGPCDEARAAAAVADLFAAIEVVENRYGDLKQLGTPTLIADQVFHAAAVIGATFADWRQLDPARLRGRIAIDEAPRGEGVGSDLLGHPLRGLAWLAASEVAAEFGGLRAGQVVLLGSVTPPVWLDGPALVSVEFPPLAPVLLRVN